jgi:hypothetical protein
LQARANDGGPLARFDSGYFDAAALRAAWDSQHHAVLADGEGHPMVAQALAARPDPSME